jgi:flagellar FliL protein
MSKKLLIISVGAVALVGAGAGAFFMLKPRPAAAAAAHGGAEAEAEAGEHPAAIVTLETFLVNLSSAQGDRFAKVDLQLTVTPAELAHEMEEDVLLTAKLRDRVLTLLTSKAAEDLLTPLGKEGLRRELKWCSRDVFRTRPPENVPRSAVRGQLGPAAG